MHNARMLESYGHSCETDRCEIAKRVVIRASWGNLSGIEVIGESRLRLDDGWIFWSWKFPGRMFD